MTKKITPADLDGVTNHSGLTPEQISERLQDGVQITYGDFGIIMEKHIVDEVRFRASQYTPDERLRIMLSVEDALKRNIRRMRGGRPVTPEHMHDTAFDLALWHVLKQSTAN